MKKYIKPSVQSKKFTPYTWMMREPITEEYFLSGQLYAYWIGTCSAALPSTVYCHWND